jgi:two-component system cell cycle response regulator DivK
MASILLVEDNELNRDMLSRRLARRGFEVVSAVDGKDGLEKAGESPPDLVLLDLNLPVLDGLEVTRRLKSDEKTRAIPVIALSAHALSEDRDRALQAGCDDFDTKPVDLPRLLAKIEAALGRAPRAVTS